MYGVYTVKGKTFHPLRILQLPSPYFTKPPRWVSKDFNYDTKSTVAREKQQLSLEREVCSLPKKTHDIEGVEEVGHMDIP